MARLQRGWSFGGLILVAALVVSAQTQQPPQPPIFRGGANLVRVDVTVTDRHGEPVTTLTADDFEIQEDNNPQTVETFKLVSADGQPPEGDDTSLDIRSPEHAAAEAARDEVRVFLIFWDEYHIARFAPAINARKALTEFVRTAFAPTDLVAMMDPLLPTDAIRWTRNRNDLAEAVRKLEGRYRVYVPVRSVLEEAQLGRRDVERLRTEVTVSALKSAASYLGGLREGRKAIVFVSQGLPGILTADEIAQLDDVVRTANDNNTAIYTLDPGGLGSGVADELRILADNTGATAFVNTNAPARALRQLVKEASAFYLLGYASTQNPTDGKFHQIKVRVKRPGLELHARRGYWAPKQSDMDRASRDAAAAAPDNVTAALATLTPRPERLVDLWVGTTRGPDGAPAVLVTWTPRAGTTPPAAATLTVAARGADGARTFDAPLQAHRLTFESAPGSVQLVTTVRDDTGQTLSEETRTIVVPDPAQTALILSTPMVIVARNAMDFRSVTADSPPFAGREFARTDRLLVRFAVYGEAASRATISARLLSKTGGALLTLPIAAPNANTGAYQIDLPLASIARGDYLISVSAESGDDHAEALVPLRIVS